MPRPSKPRRICRLPACTSFYSQSGEKQDSSGSPSGSTESEGVIYLLVEEYEAIRLIDYLGLSQESCAAQMGIARTTVQSLYADGRRKLARFLVEESALEQTSLLITTHEKIAAHLGTAREVVTRMLKYFQSEGMVRLTRGAIELLDLKRLEILAQI